MANVRDYLGTYRLVRLIRAGQTCQVWEAISDSDGSRYALKALQPDYRDDKDEIAYLRHEYEVAKDFDHPQVIHVYGFHTDRHVPFLVLELGRGKNMKLVIRERHDQLMPLMPQIVRQAAEGLSYVHQQGWIHRDVKPDNFLLEQEGQVKLVDFAIARRRRGGLGRLLAGLNRAPIQGTRSYISPEQIRGQALDQRADIYSFGCSLFELLGGKLPFTGSTPQELLNKHLRAAIPMVVSVNNNITPAFNELLMRMMAKSPADRPSSLGEFLKEMQSMRIFRTLPKPPAREDAASR